MPRSRRFLFSLLASALLASAAAANLDREIVLAPHSGTAREDAEIVRWQEAIRPAQAGASGATAENFERLGWAYIAKARRTLDAGFYVLAEKTAGVSGAEFGATPAAQFLRGHALHNLHRFAEAEEMARGLTVARGLPVDFALLSDVLVEQGKIAEAVAALQRFADSRPGAEASSRISHVRWLRGDLAGATAALEDAVRASSPREPENQAWLFMRLAALRLQAGDFAAALALADAVTARLSAYAPALLARGKAMLALGKKAEAIMALRMAAQLNPLPEYQWWLADAMRAAGREDEARATEKSIIERGERDDPRTLALFLATHGRDTARAVRLARADLTQRADVFSQDALAWALLANGEVGAADEAMRAALAEGTRDARLSLHAGEIARAAGRTEEARGHFLRAAESAGTLLPAERARLGARSVRVAAVE